MNGSSFGTDLSIIFQIFSALAYKHVGLNKYMFKNAQLLPLAF